MNDWYKSKIIYYSSHFSGIIRNYQPDILAILIISITTLYVILGGLYSVVITDVFQTAILTLGSIFIAFIAWEKLTPELLSVLPSDWTSFKIPWRLTNLPDTAGTEFEFFGALVIVWILKGLLLNAGGPAQLYDFQRFLAAWVFSSIYQNSIKLIHFFLYSRLSVKLSIFLYLLN